VAKKPAPIILKVLSQYKLHRDCWTQLCLEVSYWCAGGGIW